MHIVPEYLQELQKDKKIQVRINDNRHTMMSVRFGPKQTHVSMHRMFLTAPAAIGNALTRYITRQSRVLAPEVKAFIEEMRPRFTYSHRAPPHLLSTAGTVYDLKKLYAEINRKYFNSELQLGITWFGETRRTARVRLSLGLYYDALKLVKIHRLLDTEKVPRYVIDFIVFHEMLHAAVPSYVDATGRHHIHNKEFKQREKAFQGFSQADAWLKAHKQEFFGKI